MAVGRFVAGNGELWRTVARSALCLTDFDQGGCVWFDELDNKRSQFSN